MARKTVDNLVAEAEQIIRVWTENPAFAMSGVTLAQVQAAVAELRALQSTADGQRAQLTATLNALDAITRTVTDFITRGRSGIRGFFGPDSTQYEQVGGTRRSERKTRARKSGAGEATQGR